MRHFFHIRDGYSLITDPDGTELDCLATATEEARQHAREMLAEKLKSGQSVNGQVFEIADETGEIVGRVAFRDVLGSDNSGRAARNPISELMHRFACPQWIVIDEGEFTRSETAPTQVAIR